MKMASEAVLQPNPHDVQEDQDVKKKERGGSMSLKTRKLGRRLSRSMSIVALKLPEKAQNLTRKSSKLMRSSGRDKKRVFELSVILPDKTQRQVTVNNSSTVAEVVSDLLRELGTPLAEGPSAPLSAPLSVPLGAPLPAPLFTPPPAAALLFLGDCKAPVDSRANAAALEGEVLVIENQPPQWDGQDLNIFIAWERIYASTLLSAVELYGKPLLRAAALSNEDYHLLFFYLQAVSEASSALTERMQSYIDSGLLKWTTKEEINPRISVESLPEDQPKSILNQLVQEGLLTQRDLDISSEITTERSTSRTESKNSDQSENNMSVPKIVESICDSENTHSICDSNSHYDEDQAQFVSIISISGQCCTDHKIYSNANENVWANVRWNFLSPTDFGYDQIRSVKRSRSDSALSPIQRRKSEDLYETLEDEDDNDDEGITPYESIEDLYECIKNSQYTEKSEESAPSTESQSEPQYPDSYYDKASVTMRQSSTSSEKSAASSAFPCSKTYRNSDSNTSGSEYVSRLFPKRDLPPTPTERPLSENSESAILLQQLFSGELMDVYGEFLSSYRHARVLLRKKIRHDEHFVELAEIRKGVAKHTIADYLELPIERLAQYERLVGGGACGRRRAARLSDLERVQDLFPHDYLALHEHDALAAHANHATQKTKSLRKRPSLDLSGNHTITAGCLANASSSAPRTFVMEAPVTLRSSSEGSPSLDRHLFLFSDVLLVGKARGTNCFKLKDSVRLAETWLALSEADDTSFLIGWPSAAPGPVANYLATYPTQAARDTWYRKLQNALNTQLATEPKATNIQVLYKDIANSIEFCKTLSVSPDMTAQSVIRQALQVLQNNNIDGSEAGSWGPVQDFTLWARATRDATPAALQGIERPHAIQMSRIRQTLSSEDGFDLEHVNAKNNPCGLVFELRKKNSGLKSVTSPAGGRGLRLLRRGGSARLFGVSLLRLNNGAPPPLMLQMLRRLRVLAPHTRGVFRRSANVKDLRLLRDKLDTLGPSCTSCADLDRATVLLLAALAKDFFRSLPQPLLCDHLYHNWIGVLGLPPTEKVAAVRSLLLKLPKSHYTMLTYFVCLLQAIAKKSETNLMCPMNLGVCVGPSLLWPSVPCEKAPKAVPIVIELLIVKADVLFGPQINSLLGSGSPENALLDSGAEESDSLHSVGISLDSMELSSPRKEKLSLSRDSGLTLSEDDSNSNGGNSPAPRNILHSLSTPTCNNLPDGTKCNPTRFTTDTINVNGLPQINQRQNVYSNKSEIYGTTVNEDHYASPYSSERYVHNSINVGISQGTEKIYGTKRPDPISRSEDIYGQTPRKYITGLEPQKPPRSISKAARTSKVYSMFSESHDGERINPATKTFNRAKSSDNLLDIKQAQFDKKRELASSQENILYGNINETTLTEDHRPYQNMEFLTNTNYSRVYTGYEKRSANYNTKVNLNSQSENIYGHAGNKYEEKKYFSPSKKDGSTTQAATIFTRNDWSRQAARTKSLEANEETYVSKCSDSERRYDTCHQRRADPAHLCSKNCMQQSTKQQPEARNVSIPLQTSYSYADNIDIGSQMNDKKARHRYQTHNQRLSHSKSLANIILQSDSSSSDTLYQPQNSPFNGRSTDSTASENSFENNYAAQYAEPMYSSIYNRRRDIFHEEIASNGNQYGSDIYTAKPTAVQPDFHRTVKEQNSKNTGTHLPPPVPPRKVVYQKVVKKFPLVHANKEDKSSRSKSTPPAYRDPPKGEKSEKKTQNDVLALDCSDTDTESESYV